MKQRPYPRVIEEHDGSWSWSIEIGEAFEDDHRILAHHDGYHTRRDAQEALQEAFPAVHEKLSQEAVIELEARHRRLDEVTTAPPPAAEPQSISVAMSECDLPWGVFDADRLVALFRDRRQAEDFARQVDGWKLRRVELR